MPLFERAVVHAQAAGRAGFEDERRPAVADLIDPRGKGTVVLEKDRLSRT